MNSGLQEALSYVTIPLAKNQFELRIENLADVYDNGKTYKVDLNKIADAFWKSANVNYPIDYSVRIKEMSLTGNMEINEMMDRKV
jgi:hypothetical protein